MSDFKKQPNIVQLNNTSASAIKNILEENKVLFDTIFDNSDIGISLEDLNGKILKINPALQKMLGYGFEELLTLTNSYITHPHDLKVDLNLYKELVEGKRTQYSIEKRYLTKSGLVFYAGINRFLINNETDDKQILTLVQNHSTQQQIIDDLTSSKNLFTALLENSTDSIYYKDLDGKFLKVNKAVAIVHGFTTPEQLIGKTDFDLFKKSHAVETFNDEQQIIRTGKAIIGKEERIVWEDGNVTWFSTSKIPFYNNSGEIIGTIGITRDVTQNKVTEDLLHQERIFMRSVLNNLPDSIYTKDLDCKKTFANKRDLENMGCKTEDEAIGKTDFDFFDKEAASAFYADDQAIITKNKSIINREEHFHDDKGKEKWLLTSKIPLHNEEGKVMGVLGIGHDITERRKSEKIREALYHISEAANTTSEMSMLYIRLHEIIQELIPAKNFFIALYEEKTDIISFPYYVDENDEKRPSIKLGKDLINFIIKTGRPLLADVKTVNELVEKGHIKRPENISAIWLGVPLVLSGNTIGVIVVRDYINKDAFTRIDLQLLAFVSSQIAQVIERKRNAEAIKKYADELNQLNKTKDKFFSIIAHDLKNPFITILGFSELLLSDYSDLTDEEKLYYISEMKQSADISHNLLHNLLQWSRSQTGRIDFNPKELSIDQLICQNIELVTPSAATKKIEIEFIPCGFKNIYADEDMTSTIIRNLLSNAIKFTNKNGKILISTLDNDKSINVSIKDNGVGMSEEVKEKLFKLDASHSNLGTEKEAGTGLGLILCKEFVEKNGGTISVESQLNEGSAFNFTLPKSIN